MSEMTVRDIGRREGEIEVVSEKRCEWLKKKKMLICGKHDFFYVCATIAHNLIQNTDTIKNVSKRK
jgi:hypothetical protein